MSKVNCSVPLGRCSSIHNQFVINFFIHKSTNWGATNKRDLIKKKTEYIIRIRRKRIQIKGKNLHLMNCPELINRTPEKKEGGGNCLLSEDYAKLIRYIGLLNKGHDI